MTAQAEREPAAAAVPKARPPLPSRAPLSSRAPESSRPPPPSRAPLPPRAALPSLSLEPDDSEAHTMIARSMHTAPELVGLVLPKPPPPSMRNGPPRPPPPALPRPSLRPFDLATGAPASLRAPPNAGPATFPAVPIAAPAAVTFPAPARSNFGAESDGEMTHMVSHGGSNARDPAGDRDEMTVAHVYTTQDVLAAVAAATAAAAAAAATAAASSKAAAVGSTTPLPDAAITLPPHAWSGPPGQPDDGAFRFESSPPDDGATLAQPSPAFTEMLSEARARMEASLASEDRPHGGQSMAHEPRDPFVRTQPLASSARGPMPPPIPGASVPLDHARSLAEGRASPAPWMQSPTFSEAGPDPDRATPSPFGVALIPGAGGAPRSLSPWNGVAIDRNYFQSGPTLPADLAESGETALVNGGAPVETAAAFEPGAAFGAGPLVDEWRPEASAYAGQGARSAHDVWIPRPSVPPHPGGYPHHPGAPFAAAQYPAMGAPPGQFQPYPQQAYPQQAYPQEYAPAAVMPRRRKRNFVPIIVIIVVLFLLSLLGVLALR